MFATALTAVLLTQTREAPETALCYTGAPMIDSSSVVMDWHTVVMTLGRDSVKVEATTRFRDTSTGKAETKAVVRVPMQISGWSTNWGTNKSATWNGQAIAASGMEKGQMTTNKPGIANLNKPFISGGPTPPRIDDLVPHNTQWTLYNVSFGEWSRQRTLKTTVTLPLQVVGLDGVERQIAYRTHATSNPLSTFSVAIKYNPQLVFNVIGQTPASWNWQVGAEGAFVERKNMPMTDDVVSFRWYRGGFAPIGTTGGGTGQ